MNSLKALFNKYNHASIQDDGCVTSKQFNEFCDDVKQAFISECKNINANVVEFSKGHYDLCCFIEKNGKYVYVSYNVLRGAQRLDMNANDPFNGWLYRTAENERDYHGGVNHFASTLDLFDGIRKLLV